MKEVRHLQGLHQLQVLEIAVYLGECRSQKGAYSLCPRRDPSHSWVGVEGGDLKSRSKKWRTMTRPLWETGVTWRQRRPVRRYFSPTGKEPKSPAPSGGAFARRNTTHMPSSTVSHPRKSGQGLSISFHSFMPWEGSPAFQCPWHVGGRGVSRLTRAVTLWDVLRRNNFVKGGRTRGRQKGRIIWVVVWHTVGLKLTETTVCGREKH